MSDDVIEPSPSGLHDDTPIVVGVLAGGRLDGREVRMREGDMPAGFYTQPPIEWTAYLMGRPIELSPAIYWRWTGRTDQQGRAVFEPARPER